MPASLPPLDASPFAHRRRLIADRLSVPGTYFVNSSNSTQFQQVTDHRLVYAGSGLWLRWKNLGCIAPGQAVPVPVPGTQMSMRVGVKLSSGQSGAQVFFNGASTVSLEPDGTAEAFVPASYPAGAHLYITTLLTFAAAPANVQQTAIVTQDYANFYEAGTALVDKTAGSYSSWTSNALLNYGVFTPTTILGTPSALDPGPSLAILGDSISVGVGSNSQYVSFPGSSVLVAYIGFIQRAIAGAYPWTNIGLSGLNLQTVANSSIAAQNRFLHAITDAGVTHLLVELGTNDLQQNRTAAQVLADFATLDAICANLGITMLPFTAPPRTDSANATPTAMTSANLVALNTGLKATYGARVFDFNTAVCAPGNPLLWRSDLGTPTADGVHPSEAVVAGALAPALAASLPALVSAP